LSGPDFRGRSKSGEREKGDLEKHMIQEWEARRKKNVKDSKKKRRSSKR
jgi:hypothetical protein